MESKDGEILGMDQLTRTLMDLAERPRQVESLQAHLDGFWQVTRDRVSSLKLAVYLAERSADWPRAEVSKLDEGCEQLEWFLDRLHGYFQPLHLATIPVTMGTILGERRERWSERLADRGATLSWLAPAADEVVDLDPGQLGHVLDGFLAWRCDRISGGGAVRLSWGPGDGRVGLVWDESHEPGCESVVRTRPNGAGPSGLAMALLARVVWLHGGRVRVREEPGLRVEIELPLSGRQEWVGDETKRSPVVSRGLTAPARKA